jgi:hypothetical protein
VSDSRPGVMEFPFRPRARLLQLLGDEIIGSHRLAVFELVKNAYDADATGAIVQINLTDGREPSIIVVDDGEGMAPSTIRDVWLVPGADHRALQRRELRRTPRFNRLPLGEKGLGRFAVHKLGNRIRMVTRAKGSPECVIDIDWAELTAKPYLDETPVRVEMRDPVVFKDDRTGTRIAVTSLRDSGWTRSRRELRRLHANSPSGSRRADMTGPMNSGKCRA